MPIILSIVIVGLISFVLIYKYANKGEPEDDASLLCYSAKLLLASIVCISIGLPLFVIHFLGLHPMICLSCEAYTPEEWVDLNTQNNLIYSGMSLVAGLIFLMMFIWNRLREIPEQSSVTGKTSS